MSGMAAIWCVARSKPQTKAAISILRRICYAHLNTNLLAAGDPLDEVQREAERGLTFALKMRFRLAIDRSEPNSDRFGLSAA